MVFGWAGDKLPKRHPIFIFGIVCLLIATILLATGRHIALLIVGRFLQGLGAAVTWTSGLALLTDAMGEGRFGEAVGYAQTAVSIGTTSAPLLGGVVYAHGGYSAMSAMSIAVVVFSLTLALTIVEPSAGGDRYESIGHQAPSDINKATHDSFDDISKSGLGWNDSSADQSSSESLDERSPLIPKPRDKKHPKGLTAYPLLLRSGRILAAMTGVFTYAFVIISFETMIPLFVKDTFGWNSMHAALTFLSWIIPGMLGPLVGKTVDRFGPKWIAIGGFLFPVAPLILMRLVNHNSTSQQVLLCSLLTLIGMFRWLRCWVLRTACGPC